MGRGSAGEGKSRAAAALAESKKKSATWEVPKSGVLHDLSLEEELMNLGFEVQNKINMNRLKAEDHIDKIKAQFRKTRILLPDNVKNMNVRDYFKKYNVTLSNVSQQENKRLDTVKKRSAAMKVISEYNSDTMKKRNDQSKNTSASADSSSTMLAVPATPAVPARSKPEAFTVKTKMTPGGSAAPYIEAMEGSGLSGPALESVNKILANFRQVFEKPN
jgi:hypothetical protein